MQKHDLVMENFLKLNFNIILHIVNKSEQDSFKTIQFNYF